MSRQKYFFLSARSGARVARAIVEEKTRIIDLDLASYFDNVRHSLLLEKVARRVGDDAVMHLLKMILKATGKKGAPGWCDFTVAQ